jgi:hypothetical protein
MDKKYLHRILTNRAYLGEAVHKGNSYPGDHLPIIEQRQWDKVHSVLKVSPRKRAAHTRANTAAPLKGLLYGPDGAAFSPSHTRKDGKLYRYYVSQTVLKHGAGTCPIGRVPAGRLEETVLNQLRGIFRQPEIIAGTIHAATQNGLNIREEQIRDALMQLDPLWDELFPAEQTRILNLLIERIDLSENGLDIKIRTDGLGALTQQLTGETNEASAA